MKRAYPKHFDLVLKIAKQAKLPNPVGRALYTINRLSNGSDGLCHTIGVLSTKLKVHPTVFYYEQFNPKTERKRLVKFLRSIKPSTASRWLRHWKNDGSIKTLRSREEQNAWRRKNDRRHREALRAHRKESQSAQAVYDRILSHQQ